MQNWRMGDHTTLGHLSDRRHGFTIVFKRQFGYSEKVLAGTFNKEKAFERTCENFREVLCTALLWTLALLNVKC